MMSETKLHPKTSAKRPQRGRRKVAQIDPAPLEIAEIRPDVVPVLNAFYRRRKPVDFVVAGHTLTIAASGDVRGCTVERNAMIHLRIGCANATIDCPAALIDSLLAPLDPELSLGRHTPEQAALLLECALEDDLTSLEQLLHTSIELCSVDHAPGQMKEQAPLGLGVHWRGGDFDCTVHLDSVWALRLAALLDERQPATIPMRLDIPTRVSIWKAVTTLSLRELRSAVPGDVVVLDDMSASDKSALIVIDSHLLARARLNGDGCMVVSKPSSIQDSSWEWIMNHVSHPENEKAGDTGLDALPVTVVFELGREEMPLSEVSALAPGAVVQVANLPTEAVTILAHGKRIGQGEIVRIGDALGVRILRIFENA